MRYFYRVVNNQAVQTKRDGKIKHTPSEYSFKELMAKFNSHNMS